MVPCGSRFADWMRKAGEYVVHHCLASPLQPSFGYAPDDPAEAFLLSTSSSLDIEFTVLAPTGPEARARS